MPPRASQQGRPACAGRLLLPALRLCALLLATLAPAARADCPPQPQTPTPAQVRTLLREARDLGLLWRLERDGRVGWLYGTLHVGRRAWSAPGPNLLAALRQAEVVALEIDVSDPALPQAMARAEAPLRAQEQQAQLPAELRARLAALARSACAEGLAAQPALMQALSLTVLSGRRDGLDPAYAQEYMLGGFARAAGKPLRALESPELQLAMLAPPQVAQLAPSVEHMLAQLENGRARRGLLELAQVWADGDLERLAHYEDWCDCIDGEEDRQLMRRLNDGRNDALAAGIAALLDGGQRVFAAVGALHMTGERALPRLMAERGWSVTRVPAQPR